MALPREEVFGPEACDFGGGEGDDGASGIDGVAGVDAGEAVGFLETEFGGGDRPNTDAEVDADGNDVFTVMTDTTGFDGVLMEEGREKRFEGLGVPDLSAAPRGCRAKRCAASSVNKPRLASVRMMR